jgi:hypothetical protein
MWIFLLVRQKEFVKHGVGKAETVLNGWVVGVIDHDFALNMLYWAGEQPWLMRRKCG